MLTLVAASWARAAITVVHVYDLDFSVNPKGQPVVDPVINTGDTIRWVWDEGIHSTTAGSGQSMSWDSGDHIPTFTFDVTFPLVGSFNYYCDVHGADLGGGNLIGMVGTISVIPEPAAQASLVALALLGFVVWRWKSSRRS